MPDTTIALRKAKQHQNHDANNEYDSHYARYPLQGRLTLSSLFTTPYSLSVRRLMNRVMIWYDDTKQTTNQNEQHTTELK